MTRRRLDEELALSTGGLREAEDAVQRVLYLRACVRARAYVRAVLAVSWPDERSAPYGLDLLTEAYAVVEHVKLRMPQPCSQHSVVEYASNLDRLRASGVVLERVELLSASSCSHEMEHGIVASDAQRPTSIIINIIRCCCSCCSS